MVSPFVNVILKWVIKKQHGLLQKKPVARNNQDFINRKDDELNKNGFIIAQGNSILQDGFDENAMV